MKYKEKKFVKPSEKSPEELSKDLIGALRAKDYRLILKLVLQGANLSWKNPEDKQKSLLHYMVEDDNPAGFHILKIISTLNHNVVDVDGKYIYSVTDVICR